MNRIKIIIIDKTAVLKKYQKKCEELAKYKDIDLTLFVPEVWIENFQKISLEKRNDPNYTILTGKCFFKGYENRGFYYDFDLLKTIKKIQPDLICMLEEPFSLFALQIVLLRNIFARKARICFYSSDNHSWNHRYPYHLSFLYRMIFNYTAKNSDVAAVIYEEAKKILRSKGFNKPIYNFSWGVDTSSFRKTKSLDIRKKLNLHGKVIGYLGRLIKIKGIETLIKAVSKLDDRSVKLLIVGDGPDKKYFQEIALNEKIEDRVVFVDYVKPEKVYKYYGAMDLFVLPSYKEFKERFGRVLIEAMACGVPVIGSNTGGIPEVIEEAGFLFTERNVKQLRDKIKLVLNNSSIKENLIKKGEEKVKSKYTWKTFAKQMHDIILKSML